MSKVKHGFPVAPLGWVTYTYTNKVKWIKIIFHKTSESLKIKYQKIWKWAASTTQKHHLKYVFTKTAVTWELDEFLFSFFLQDVANKFSYRYLLKQRQLIKHNHSKNLIHWMYLKCPGKLSNVARGEAG